MIISLIAAVGQNGVIGQDGGLPWRIPEDLKRFKATTLGKPVIMGRKTFESIGHPLVNRHNIVLTRSQLYEAPGCTVVHSIGQALDAARGNMEVMIIGGGAVYKLFLPQAQRIYLTEIEEQFEGEVFFPRLEYKKWKEVSRESILSSEKNPFTFHFVVYERITSTVSEAGDKPTAGA